MPFLVYTFRSIRNRRFIGAKMEAFLTVTWWLGTIALAQVRHYSPWHPAVFFRRSKCSVGCLSKKPLAIFSKVQYDLLSNLKLQMFPSEPNGNQCCQLAFFNARFHKFGLFSTRFYKSGIFESDLALKILKFLYCLAFFFFAKILLALGILKFIK